MSRHRLQFDDDDFDTFDGEMIDTMAPDEGDEVAAAPRAEAGGPTTNLMDMGGIPIAGPKKKGGKKKGGKKKGGKKPTAMDSAGGLFGALDDKKSHVVTIPREAPASGWTSSSAAATGGGSQAPAAAAATGISRESEASQLRNDPLGVGPALPTKASSRADGAHSVRESSLTAATRRAHRRGRERVLPTATQSLPAVPAAVQRVVAAGRQRVSLVVVGHVDAGKSTLLGHLLYQLGEVTERTMRAFRRDAEAMGKRSFAFAWVMDAGADERSRGVTVDVGSAQFASSKTDFYLLDAPGHRDFVPNMITGASQADAAVLVVPAPASEFERSFERAGQTKEHAVLLHSLGVKQIIVAVNKMDTTGWDESQFRHVCQRVGKFLVQKVGYAARNVIFVPVSGLEGVNLTRSLDAEAEAVAAKERGEPGVGASGEHGPEGDDEGEEPTMSSKLRNASHWYRTFLQSHRQQAHQKTQLPPAACPCPTLLDALEAIRPADTRAIHQPLRLCIADVSRGSGARDATVFGRIESGFVAPHQKLCAIPGDEVGTVKALSMVGGGDSAGAGAAGQSVGGRGAASEDIFADNDDDATAGGGTDADRDASVYAWAGSTAQLTVGGFGENMLRAGQVLCWPSHQIPVATEVKAEVHMLPMQSPIPLMEGQQAVFHAHNVTVPCNVVRLKYLVNPDGSIGRRRLKFLPKDATAVVRIRLVRPVAIEPFKDNARLGRFLLRYSGMTIAAGLVLRTYR